MKTTLTLSEFTISYHATTIPRPYQFEDLVLVEDLEVKALTEIGPIDLMNQALLAIEDNEFPNRIII